MNATPTHGFTTSETARALNRSEATVREWERRGYLTAVRIGRNRTRVFSPSTIEHMKQRLADLEREGIGDIPIRPTTTRPTPDRC